MRVLKEDGPGSSQGHTIPVTFLFLSVSGGPYVLSGHLLQTAESPGIPAYQFLDKLELHSLYTPVVCLYMLISH